MKSSVRAASKIEQCTGKQNNDHEPVQGLFAHMQWPLQISAKTAAFSVVIMMHRIMVWNFIRGLLWNQNRLDAQTLLGFG